MNIRNTHLTLARALSGGAVGLRSFHFDKDAAPEAPADPFATQRQEFAKLQTEALDLVKVAREASRELTAEEKTANETRFSRMNAIKATLDEHERFASLALAGDTSKGRVDRPREQPGREEFNASEGRGAAEVADDGDPFKLSTDDRQKYKRELRRYVSDGEMGPMARRFATITTGTSSGFMLPRSIGTPIIPTSANAFRAAFDAYGVKPIETANTADLTLPVLDASSGGVVAENASSETENTPGSGESIKLTPKTYQSGSVWFSNQQLAAVDIDLLQTIVPQLQYSKELGLESAIAAALIADSGVTQNVVTATMTGFAYANLVDLNQKLPARYNTQKAIVLSAAAYAAAEKLVGSDGHPVLNLDPQNGSVKRFNGTPVIRSDFLQAFGVSQVVGAIFSLLGFGLRDVTYQNLARYVNVPSRPNQTGLNLFAYHAYGWAPSAVAKFISAAS